MNGIFRKTIRKKWDYQVQCCSKEFKVINVGRRASSPYKKADEGSII